MNRANVGALRQRVNDIVQYLNSDEVIFPNSLILAIDSTVKFKNKRLMRCRLICR